MLEHNLFNIYYSRLISIIANGECEEILCKIHEGPNLASWSIEVHTLVPFWNTFRTIVATFVVLIRAGDKLGTDPNRARDLQTACFSWLACLSSSNGHQAIPFSFQLVE